MAWLATLFAALVPVIVALIKALLPAIVEGRKPTPEDGAPDTATRDKLRDQLRSAGWCILLCMMVFLVGCGGTRTIYVPHGTPVRLRKTIPDAEVWVKDKDGTPVKGNLDLEEGWYCLSIEDEDEEAP